jgi:hypothetical protein
MVTVQSFWVVPVTEHTIPPPLIDGPLPMYQPAAVHVTLNVTVPVKKFSHTLAGFPACIEQLIPDGVEATL